MHTEVAAQLHYFHIVLSTRMFTGDGRPRGHVDVWSDLQGSGRSYPFAHVDHPGTCDFNGNTHHGDLAPTTPLNHARAHLCARVCYTRSPFGKVAKTPGWPRSSTAQACPRRKRLSRSPRAASPTGRNEGGITDGKFNHSRGLVAVTGECNRILIPHRH